MQRLRRRAALWAEEGIDLLFPPRCVLCHLDLDRGGDAGSFGGASVDRVLCPTCFRSLATDGVRCSHCGEPGPTAGCRGCGGRGQPWEGIMVLGGYGDLLREAVLRCKRPGGDEVSRGLATLLVDRRRDVLAGWGVDCVVPVPMHWLRRMARGTSAADVIATRMARLLRLPVLRALSRPRATRMQNELPVHERLGNVAAAFRVRRPMAGRRVLVVDDVVTTGSTLAACSRTIRAGGAAAVFVAAIARADRAAEST